jgi:ribosomal protein S18 acetylase RimI-like enzyme
MCDLQGEETEQDGHLRLKPSVFDSAADYREMLLDTLPSMEVAIQIYRSLGFEPIPPYWNNTVLGILYFGRLLSDGP